MDYKILCLSFLILTSCAAFNDHDLRPIMDIRAKMENCILRMRNLGSITSSKAYKICADIYGIEKEKDDSNEDNN